MQWMVPHTRLGETQLHVLDSCMRDDVSRHWIRGFAGSGKTVLLVHCIVEALTKNPDLSVCVVVYTHTLKDLVSTGIPEHLGAIPVMTYHQFWRNPRFYDLIIVDEVQDLEKRVLQLLVKNSGRLVIAGDEDQSIYEDRVSSGDIERIVSPSKHKLEVLYRLTEALRDVVRTILPDSLIHGARISRMGNVQITLAQGENELQETGWVWQQGRKFSKQGDPAVILLPRHSSIRRFIDLVCDEEGVRRPDYENNAYGRLDYDLVNEHLKDCGLGLQYLGNSHGSLAESDERPIVYLMTYHSAKGLDYETVFLPYLADGIDFWPRDAAMDRRLFFVAATRSRRNLFMSYSSSQPHSYIRAMPEERLHKITCVVQDETADDAGFIF